MKNFFRDLFERITMGVVLVGWTLITLGSCIACVAVYSQVFAWIPRGVA